MCFNFNSTELVIGYNNNNNKQQQILLKIGK